MIIHWLSTWLKLRLKEDCSIGICWQTDVRTMKMRRVLHFTVRTSDPKPNNRVDMRRIFLSKKKRRRRINAKSERDAWRDVEREREAAAAATLHGNGKWLVPSLWTGGKIKKNKKKKKKKNLRLFFSSLFLVSFIFFIFFIFPIAMASHRFNLYFFSLFFSLRSLALTFCIRKTTAHALELSISLFFFYFSSSFFIKKRGERGEKSSLATTTTGAEAAAAATNTWKGAGPII